MAGKGEDGRRQPSKGGDAQLGEVEDGKEPLHVASQRGEEHAPEDDALDVEAAQIVHHEYRLARTPYFQTNVDFFQDMVHLGNAHHE